MESARDKLKVWILQALQELGGRATIVDVAEQIWNRHEAELRLSGKLLFTWQYDMRWAAMILRKQKLLVSSGNEERGVWALSSSD
jgi:hypothetical protein